MIDMSSNMTGTDDNTLMMANALSRLGDTLTHYGADFGPKSLQDVMKITGMSKEIIQSLINKAKAEPAAEAVSEGLADMADIAERDHEVQMARAELYKIAKYSIKLHEMLKGVSEAEGIEGWMQSKITKAADYIGSVYHTLDYDNSPIATESHKFTMSDEDVDAYKSKLSEDFQKKRSEKVDEILPALAWTAGRMAAKHLAKKALKKMATRSVAKGAILTPSALNKNEPTPERALSKGEEKDKEKYVKGMKKAKGDFEKRYGKDAKAVMYATATKMAKKKGSK